jgi:MFS family permease
VTPAGRRTRRADPNRAQPIREVLGLAQFRGYWLTQFLSGLGNGSLRFTFVWLALDLSDSSSAAAIVALSLGLPALVVNLPAGAIADRWDRRRLIVQVECAVAVVLAAIAVVAWTDAMTLPLASASAVVAGALFALVGPALQGLVPALVPAHRLMTGVALHTMALNCSLLFGAVVGGAAIALAGVGGAFAVIAVLQVVAALTMRGVHVGAADHRSMDSMWTSVGKGFVFARRHEPVRTLLAATVIVGFAWACLQILLPEISRDVLHEDAFATSMLFASLSVGLVISSLIIASRDIVSRPGWWIAVSLSVGVGGTLVVVGASRLWMLTCVAMLAWGALTGAVMSLGRTLQQQHTPDALMGRLMGLNLLALQGTFPFAAGVVAAVSWVLGPADALAVLGVVTAVVGAVVGLRAPMRRADATPPIDAAPSQLRADAVT